MISEALIKELSGSFAGIFQSNNLELVDLICRPEGRRVVLTVLADKPQGGINLQECAVLCRQLKNLIEERNLISVDYLLEVSSPGLDRPLKQPKDFARFIDKEAVFFLKDLIEGKCQWQGIIKQVDETAVFIQVEGRLLEIPLIKINKAQLVI
ncbi:MAG TPA: ribosome maturation factor RimP [Candidatus Omnitrophota bacterium]|nr:ribosome maturation factor RimP [Candidatus Omnitrophota bacterium]HPT38650.1 ribosome maturation factor RimP [Candidatus Omnitrophota bacterium]